MLEQTQKKFPLFSKIPRVVYYMAPWDAVLNFFKVIFSPFQYNLVSTFKRNIADSYGCNHVHVTAHARSALHFLLNSLDLDFKTGVIMTPINIPDMVNIFHINNIKIFLADYEKNSFTVDLDICKKIVEKNDIKIFFLTHLSGICGNVEQVRNFCCEHGLIYIQDCTQIVGMQRNRRPLTDYADYTIYSLCDLKDVHTHRGGLICHNKSSEIFNKIEDIIQTKSTQPSKTYFLSFIFEDFIGALSVRRIFFSLLIYPLLLLFDKMNIQHAVEEMSSGRGIKIFGRHILRGFFGGSGDIVKSELEPQLIYRFTDLQAKIGMKQLKQYRSRIVSRTKNSIQFKNSIRNFQNLLKWDCPEAVFWKYPILTDQYQSLQRYLLVYGVDSARSNLKSFSELDIFKDIVHGECPNAEYLANNILYIPLHHYLSESEIEKIAGIVNNYKSL